MRTSYTALLAVGLVLGAAQVVEGSALEDIQTANQGGQVVFLLVTEPGAPQLDGMRAAAKSAKESVKNSVVVELDRSDAAQAAAVKRYKLQATPLPLVLVIAPNGVAAGGSRPGEGAAARLVSLVPSPKKADVMQAFEQRQTAVIVFSRAEMQERSPLFENLTAVSREMKETVRLVLVDLDDKAEKRFIEEWSVPMDSKRPTVAVLNSKGQALGRLVGAPATELLLETCKKKAPCCGDPNCKGCEGE